MASPQLNQIKKNSTFVAERFGPVSEMKSFGCNADTFAYLDDFISRQSQTITKDASTKNRFISLFGSFLGECIISSYGGAWVEHIDGIQINIPSNEKIIIILPFEKVVKRIQFGDPESLAVYFRDALPAALSK